MIFFSSHLFYSIGLITKHARRYFARLKARFSRPLGVASTADGAAYLSDSVSCRIRRAAPTVSFAAALATCNTTLTEVLRPSGCSSYDPFQGGDGLTATPLSGNIWYNHWRNLTGQSSQEDAQTSNLGDSVIPAVSTRATSHGTHYNAEDSNYASGRVVRQCIGFPPPYLLDRPGDPHKALTVDDGLTSVFEDTSVGTTIRLACPTSCALKAEGGPVRGSPTFYTDDSAVCMAAVHAGVLSADSATSPAPPAPSSTWSSSDQTSGEDAESVVIVIARLVPGNVSDAFPRARLGFDANNVSAEDAPGAWARGFALEAALPSEITVQTIAGRATGALGEGCGPPKNGQPPQEAIFRKPMGIDAWRSVNLTDEVGWIICLGREVNEGED